MMFPRFLMLFAALLSSCWAQPVPAGEDVPGARPKVALVLSGGGARGFAHSGVLQVLQELQVPVDIVVGTSMGAVIGGAYAAGRTVDELQAITRATAWENLLSDRPARDELDYRRKEDDALVRSRIEFQVSSGALSLPRAIAGNTGLERALTRLLPSHLQQTPVDQLALPFRSVASDLLTGDLVELKAVPLFVALRASLSVPGVFAPVRMGERLLVDGGLVRNLPVDLARAMGAQIIIAVNVGTPLGTEESLGSALGVANQMLQILTEQNVQRSIRELQPQDILIAPDLRNVSFLDFNRHQQATEAGIAAARQVAPLLKALAVSPAQYAALEERRTARSRTTVLVKAPELTAEQLSHAAALTPTDKPPMPSPAAQAVAAALAPEQTPPQRLRLGLEMESDFSQVNRFTLKALYTVPHLNAWGGELRTTAQVGAAQALQVQWWQPLAKESPWYLAGSVALDSSTRDLFDEGRRLARIGQRSGTLSLALGRQFANWGDLRMGLSRVNSRSTALIPEEALAGTERQLASTGFIEYKIDTLDALEFPTRGNYFQTRWERSRTPGLAQPTDISASVLALSALQVGPWAGHLYGEWAKAQLGSAPVSLGGFLRLSGTTPVSIEGQTVILGRLVLARQVGVMPGALGGGPVRLGLSAELGGGFRAGQSESLSALKQAGSGFVSIDTRLGHLYFGAGATRGTGSSLYVFFGPSW